jgi:hypothetical protein
MKKLKNCGVKVSSNVAKDSEVYLVVIPLTFKCGR